MGESSDNGSAEEEQGIAGELDRSDVVNVSNITNDPNYENSSIYIEIKEAGGTAISFTDNMSTGIGGFAWLSRPIHMGCFSP